jgi:outer membrane protein assembly factor BamB
MNKLILRVIRGNGFVAIAAVLSAGLFGAVAGGGTALGSTALGSTAAGSARTQPVPATDWPAYLEGPAHDSYAPSQTAISPATAPNLQQEWQVGMGGVVLASPTVAAGAVFIGSNGGWLYKLSEQTGQVLARVFIGHQPKKSCPATGVVSTATYAHDPVTGRGSVYVAGPDGYLYALRASNLSREWRSAIAIPSSTSSDYFDWSSPTVANGKIYVGVASNCDHPLVRGGVIDYDQATGQKIAEFYTVPKGAVGGSVWSSVGVGANGDVYATTGNGPASHPRLAYSESILKLSPASLTLLGRFQVPAGQVSFDGDFGGSPVMAGGLVGACNKNGIFYLLDQTTMKVAWEQRIGAPSGMGSCLATPAYDGTDLFVGGNDTAIDVNGIATGFDGSVQERVAATGALVWQTGMTGDVLGSPTLDGAGVIAAGMYSGPPNGVDLLDAANGQIVAQLAPGIDFAQSVFADNWLFTATGNTVAAWGLKASS